MNKLKFYRKKLHLTQKEVADYLKISQPTYANLENEKINIKLQDALKLSELFKINTSELIGATAKIISLTTDEFKTLQQAKDIIIKLENKYNL